MKTRVHRRAGILAAALVCLMIVMLYTAVVARSIVIRQRTTKWEERQTQCFWLAESALARGLTRARLQSDYTGESWRVDLVDPQRGLAGVADIRVEPAAGEPGAKRIVVDARWPDDPLDRVVWHKELVFSPSLEGVPR
jgi:hypothetical protein